MNETDEIDPDKAKKAKHNLKQTTMNKTFQKKAL